MRPHKISIKRKKSFNLNHQKNKFVLFIDDGKKFDNELPFDLVKGDHIFIKRHRIHRIHKGTTDLKIRING